MTLMPKKFIESQHYDDDAESAYARELDGCWRDMLIITLIGVSILIGFLIGC